MIKAKKIEEWLASHESGTKSVLTGNAITEADIAMADVAIGKDEKILLLVKTWGVVGEKSAELAKKVTFGGLGKMLGKAMQATRMGTFVVTDKCVHWARLRPDSAVAGITGIVGKINGSCSLDDLSQAMIGEHDHCVGSAYMGHQLLINGKMIGLLRMGAGIECDEKAIEYLNAFFTACINS